MPCWRVADLHLAGTLDIGGRPVWPYCPAAITSEQQWNVRAAVKTDRANWSNTHTKIVVGLAVAGAAVASFFTFALDGPKADYHAMRSFAMSRLTDDDLRRFDAEARAEYAAEYASGLEGHRAWLRQRSEERARCDDAAFRTRFPGACTMSFSEMLPFDPIIVSVPMRIDMKIMGVCLYGPFSIREAQRLRCLP